MADAMTRFTPLGSWRPIRSASLMVRPTAIADELDRAASLEEPLASTYVRPAAISATAANASAR